MATPPVAEPAQAPAGLYVYEQDGVRFASFLPAGYSVELDVWDWAPGEDFVARMAAVMASLAGRVEPGPQSLRRKMIRLRTHQRPPLRMRVRAQAFA